MITILIRSTILFLFAVLSMRIMGKRQVSQLQPYELVISVMIAELASTPMEDVGVPLLYGIAPMLMLVILHSLLSIVSLKNQTMRALISGKPSILISNGVIQEAELKRLCFDLNDLLEELRASGSLSPVDVGTAIMETSGKMSVFPVAEKRPVTPGDMSLAVDSEGIPLTLILDGEVQQKNLTLGGLDMNWLQNTLAMAGFSSPTDVFFASVDTQGMLFAHGRGSKPRIVMKQVLNPVHVGW